MHNAWYRAGAKQTFTQVSDSEGRWAGDSFHFCVSVSVYSFSWESQWKIMISAIWFFVLSAPFSLSLLSLVSHMLTPGGWDRSQMHKRKEEEKSKNSITVSLTICLRGAKSFSPTTMLTSKRGSSLALKKTRLKQWGQLTRGGGNIFRVISRGNGKKIGPWKCLFLEGPLSYSPTMLSVTGLDCGSPCWI